VKIYLGIALKNWTKSIFRLTGLLLAGIIGHGLAQGLAEKSAMAL